VRHRAGDRLEVVEQPQVDDVRVAAGLRQRHRPRKIAVDQRVAFQASGDRHHRMLGPHRIDIDRHGIGERAQDRRQAGVRSAGIASVLEHGHLAVLAHLHQSQACIRAADISGDERLPGTQAGGGFDSGITVRGRLGGRADCA
jgi:hypothetical protein